MSNNKSQEKFNYLTYGEKCKADDVKLFIRHMVDTNLGTARPTPVCIWGLAGIGKTSIVEQIANEKGYEYRYIAPAQFEEMGDMLGMPYVDKETNETKFAIPEWVPTTEGPGILLIDDVNRADDRILRGIMQLLQNYELVSWQLPKGWQIVLTANPDGGDYSVTSMDDAMLTRMMHITMEFDVKEWAKWAEINGVDERGINFLLKYPEIVDGEQTNPRSLTNFFNAIRKIKDLRKDIKLVNLLSKSSLSKEAATSFQQFINDNLIDLISPDEILTAEKWETVEKVIINSIQPNEEGMIRNDIAMILTTRFINYIGLDRTRKYNKEELNNIVKFISLKQLPKDMRMLMIKDIHNMVSYNSSLKAVLMADGVIDEIMI